MSGKSLNFVDAFLWESRRAPRILSSPTGNTVLRTAYFECYAARIDRSYQCFFYQVVMRMHLFTILLCNVFISVLLLSHDASRTKMTIADAQNSTGKSLDSGWAFCMHAIVSLHPCILCTISLDTSRSVHLGKVAIQQLLVHTGSARDAQWFGQPVPSDQMILLDELFFPDSTDPLCC